MQQLLIYGAYGYTGILIIEECLRKGIKPKVAGRDVEKIRDLGLKYEIPWEALDLTNEAELLEWLKTGSVVIHCAGPFIHTAQVMIEACLKTDTHYMDITGEYQVFDLAKEYDKEAQEKGLMLLPGAGFDVVPSDCLAAKLATELSGATSLELAFTSKGGKLSRGTAKTMIENLGDPQVRRENGEYVLESMGKRAKEINYGKFSQLSMGISWGDISTAFHSTKIPTIEVYTGTTEKQLSRVKKMLLLSFILKSDIAKTYLKKQIDKKPAGPEPEQREKANMYLYGKVSDGKEEVEARLRTPNGYTLTALASAHIAEEILKDQYKSGYQTPSTAYGYELITKLEGCQFV